MAANLRLIYTCGNYRRYVVTCDESGAWCEVSVFNGSLTLSSFGGELWPGSFPEFFEHFGPDAGCITHRSGYKFRAEAISWIESKEAE